MRNPLALLLLLGITLSLAACTVWREHPVTAWSDATGGEGVERMFWKDVKTANWKDLERHLAPKFVALTPEGKLDRAAALDRLRQYKLEEFSLGEVQTELHGSTFVVTYDITLSGTSAGQPLPSAPMRVMTVWQQQKMGWMAIAQTLTIAPGK